MAGWHFKKCPLWRLFDFANSDVNEESRLLIRLNEEKMKHILMSSFLILI